MPFQVFDISDRLLERLTEINEGHYFETKAADRFDPIAKTLSAFANTDGGRLIIGVADSKVQTGRPSGYNNQEDANGHITEITKMFAQVPDAVNMDFYRPKSLPQLLLNVDVDKCASIISTPSDEIYVRRNAQNIRLRATQQIQELAWRKGLESYESVLTEELEGFIDSSEVFRTYQEHQIPFAEGRSYIKKEKLVRDGRATVAAVMLFDDNPQATVTQGAVKLYRYKSIKDQGERDELAGDPITIEGPAHDLVYRAVECTVEIIESIEVLGTKGFEKIKYPTRSHT